jgi:iron complex outermembrane recepter protein
MIEIETRAFKAARLLLAATGAIAMALPVSSVFASEPANDAAGDAEGGGLSEVVVTANRRSESAQNVPIAVTAISAEQVAALGIQDPQMLQMVIPGLVMQRVSAFSTPFIRGVGSLTVSPTIETSTATYVDDVYVPSSTSALANLNSIEHLEVLKGPQGTLFGRNATAGVLQVFTKNPTATPSLDVTAGYANYDTYSGSIYASGPLAQNVAANIALYGSDQRDGFGHIINTGEPVGRNWDYGGRSKLLVTPTDSLTLLATVFFDKTFTQQGLVTRAAYGTRNAGGYLAPSYYYDMYSDVTPFITNKQYGASLKITQDFGFANLTSISAFQSARLTFQQEAQYGDPRPIIDVNQTGPQRTWTQEIRFGAAESARIKWIIGAFFFNDAGGVGLYQFSGSIVGAANDYARTVDEQKTTSYAGFGQVTIPLVADTNLTAGARYSHDDRTMTAASYIKAKGLPDPPYTLAANSPQETQFGSGTYRLSLDHQFGKDLLGYVAYNRGAKAGFFNTLLTPTLNGKPILIAPAVKPEKLDSYTAGFKAEFLDHKLRVNTEGFYYKYKDIQLTQNTLTSPVFTNAGAATFKGVDIDVTARPIPDLTLAAGAELMKGTYDSYANGAFLVYNPSPGGNCNFTVIPGGPVPCGGRAIPPHYNPVTGTWNLAGNDTVNTPQVSLTFEANYTFHTTIGPVDVNGALKHTGAYYADADNGLGQVAPSSQGNDRQRAINIVNASVAWHSPGDAWLVRLWGANLTDVQYFSLGAESAPAIRWNPAPPRTYGITVSRHF